MQDVHPVDVDFRIGQALGQRRQGARSVRQHRREHPSLLGYQPGLANDPPSTLGITDNHAHDPDVFETKRRQRVDVDAAVRHDLGEPGQLAGTIGEMNGEFGHGWFRYEPYPSWKLRVGAEYDQGEKEHGLAETYYERLSFLDSTFLAMEDRNAHFHVAGVMKFAPGGLRTPDGSVDIESLKAHIESKLHRIPRYRQVLDWIPIEDHPVWVDDAFFDIDYHVRRATLTDERDDEELQRLTGTIFSQKLDRFRPLWEIWIVDGFKDDSLAMITKVHHCMIDGMAGVDLMKELLAPFPITDIGPIEPYQPRPSPSKTELLADEAVRRATMPLHALRNLRHLSDSLAGLAGEVDTRLRAMGKALGAGWLKNASRTPLNARIGPNREFKWMRVDLADAKSIKNAFGGTINDVVLSTVAGAVRKYLLAHDAGVDHLDFRVMAPVSVRSESDQSLGNQVAMWLLDLPIDLTTPRQRYRRIAEETEELKETNQALGASLLVQATSWTPSTILTSAMRLAGTNVRPFNMTVTNVPGPQIPIYFLDAHARGAVSDGAAVD